MKTFFVTVIILLVGLTLFYFFGTPKPALSLTPNAGPIAARKEIVVKIGVSRGALNKLVATATQGEKSVTVFTKDYTPASKEAVEKFDLAQAGLQEGAFTLQVKGTSSASFRANRSSTETHSFTYENRPPSVSVLSTAHNIIRGGAGLVVYTVSKEVDRTGVIFANRFYPGYRQEGGFYACLFPFPYDMDPNQYVPRVVAIDKAGNERQVDINYHLIAKNFTTDKINLTDPFLEKIAADFKYKFPQAATPLDIFLKVNRDERQRDRQVVVDHGRQTSPVPLWQGEFLRMPNAAPLGGFAQARTYLYQGKEVDQQTHLGFDLASLARAPVPAANHGRVILTDDLGIYGQCIIIDHGMGLQTLYGHLSQIGVKVGESVKKGQTIAYTGATGMAAGDHLHYEVIISGQPVNPIEWWDPSWIKNNVTSKLEMAKGQGTK